MDLNFPFDNPGESLYLKLDGRLQMHFAELTFTNGQVQVVDFNQRLQDSGIFELLDFMDGRKAENVRLLAKAITK